MLPVRKQEKTRLSRSLSRFSKTFFLLSNQIYQKFKSNQNMRTFYNEIVDSENVQLKQKLPDEENQILSHVGILLL